MYNWSKFVFTWTHGYNDPKLITNYSAYYRSRFVFTEFVDVRLTCIWATKFCVIIQHGRAIFWSQPQTSTRGWTLGVMDPAVKRQLNFWNWNNAIYMFQIHLTGTDFSVLLSTRLWFSIDVVFSTCGKYRQLTDIVFSKSMLNISTTQHSVAGPCVLTLDCVLIIGPIFIFTSAREFMFSSAFVCLSVSKITQNPLNRFSQNSVEMWNTGHGRNHSILVVIRIMLRLRYG